MPACKCSVDYSLALLILGFVVTLAGQSSTYWLMGRLQRRSIVIIAMALLMLLAALTMCYESIVVFWMRYMSTHCQKGATYVWKNNVETMPNSCKLLNHD